MALQGGNPLVEILQGVGALGQQQLAQQQLGYNPFANASGTAVGTTITANYDLVTDTVSYAMGAERQPMEAQEIAPRNNVEWLERRVNEVRVKM